MTTDLLQQQRELQARRNEENNKLPPLFRECLDLRRRSAQREQEKGRMWNGVGVGSKGAQWVDLAYSCKRQYRAVAHTVHSTDFCKTRIFRAIHENKYA